MGGGGGAACQQYTSVPPLPAPGMHVHRAAQPPQPQQHLEAVQLGAATIKPSSNMIHSDIRAPCREGARFCACMAVVHSCRTDHNAEAAVQQACAQQIEHPSTESRTVWLSRMPSYQSRAPSTWVLAEEGCCTRATLHRQRRTGFLTPTPLQRVASQLPAIHMGY